MLRQQPAISAFLAQKGRPLPAMVGPVTSASRPPSSSAPDRSQALANATARRAGERRLDHRRCAAVLDLEGERIVDPRPRPGALDRESGERGGDVDLGQRLRLMPRNASPLAKACWRSRSNAVEPSASARSAAEAMRASSSISALVVKRHRAGHRLGDG